MKLLSVRTGLILMVAAMAGACATTSAPPVAAPPAEPRYAEYPVPAIPSSLQVTDAVRQRHASAWNRLQAGDLRGASRDFNAALSQMPGLYPAEAGLGFVDLANRDFEDAIGRFAAALTLDDTYLPAWMGQADALLGLGRDAEAARTMEYVLKLDPTRELVRTRLEFVRFRLTQSSLEAAQRARTEGRIDEAVRHFEHALTMAPESTMILQELAQTQLSAGRLDEAERYVRRTIQLEPRVAGWHALLGDVLERRERYSEAADAFANADRLESNAAWSERTRVLREKAVLASLPAEFARVAPATTITRGEVAAYIGIHLSGLVERAPAQATAVATDIREHWAAPWIVPVTRAGIMAIFPNHTFQPTAPVTRGDLATIAASLIRQVGASRPGELARWQTARPQFSDLPPAHVFYPAAALATTVKVMGPDTAGRFEPTRPASGPELEAVVRRIAALLGS